MMHPVITILVLLLQLSRAVESSKDASDHAGFPSTGCTCPCTSEQQQGGQAMSQLVDAPATQKHVMIKVRMLPTAASTLLRAVKQDVTGARGPEPWVAALVNSTTAATAQQLDVPASALRVTLEASLGSGLSVPSAPLNRQQAAVDALAEFYEQVTGSTSLLVGLNLVQPPGPKPHPANSSSSNGSPSNKQQGTVLALATINGPFGDLAHVLHMADIMQHRCQELFQLGAVLNLSHESSAGCAAWLRERYTPVLHAGQEGNRKVALMPAAAAALKGAVPPAADGAHMVVDQAEVVLPMQVNIKLSMTLSLSGHSTDPDVLISRARSWLASPALDQMLQQHGLHIGAGSPAHLVTLLSAPGGIGGYKGVDEVIEVDGSDSVAAAAAGTGSGSGHHEAQPELGYAHSSRSSGSYSASGMSAWGRLQPQELGPLVAGHANAAALAAVPHVAAGTAGGGSQATEDDEIGRRTVLGAIIGAVLGSAAAGAALALFVASVARRRRAAELQQAGSGLNACGEASDRPGRDSAQASSGGGRRRRSRKRYLKYLPTMSAPHLLPVAAPPASPSTAGPSSVSGAGSTLGVVMDGSPAPPTAVGTPVSSTVLALSQQLHQGSIPAGGIESSSAAGGPAVVEQGSAPLAAAPGGMLLQSSRSAGVALLAEQQPLHQQEGGLSGVVQQQEEHQPAPAVQHQQQQQLPQQQSSVRSRLLLGFALLRPAASDPLMQAPSRTRRAEVRHHSGGLWAADGAITPALTRQELCSDSVSSAARLDVLQSLQRSASAGSSEGASVAGRSNSGSSMGRGMGSAASDSSSSRPVSPSEGSCCELRPAPGPHSSGGGVCVLTTQAAQAAVGLTSRPGGLTISAGQIRGEGMGAQHQAVAAPLPLPAVAGPCSAGNRQGWQLDSQQQPPTAWLTPFEPNVAAAGTSAQCKKGYPVPDEECAHRSSSSPASSRLTAAAEDATRECSAAAEACTGRGAATGSAVVKASPFLRYDFAALEHQ